ncbi:hypothetical protein L917_20432 [Phytophthora nicotianae]|uniref:Transposase IS30-like HTH domain-containing protein n=1 Tax=Phytophthora nicotianae TaxID=4792 RepID=W2K313_PHYNI|nr:hypothetical protein L917_20432 [Phytophthora nicotianae]
MASKPRLQDEEHGRIKGLFEANLSESQIAKRTGRSRETITRTHQLESAQGGLRPFQSVKYVVLYARLLLASTALYDGRQDGAHKPECNRDLQGSTSSAAAESTGRLQPTILGAIDEIARQPTLDPAQVWKIIRQRFYQDNEGVVGGLRKEQVEPVLPNQTEKFR